MSSAFSQMRLWIQIGFLLSEDQEHNDDEKGEDNGGDDVEQRGEGVFRGGERAVRGVGRNRIGLRRGHG